MIDATQTTRGLVPHARHPRLGILMPVRLATRESVLVNPGSGGVKRGRQLISDGRGVPAAERTADGRPVYALPGGGSYVFPRQ